MGGGVGGCSRAAALGAPLRLVVPKGQLLQSMLRKNPEGRRSHLHRSGSLTPRMQYRSLKIKHQSTADVWTCTDADHTRIQ